MIEITANKLRKNMRQKIQHCIICLLDNWMFTNVKVETTIMAMRPICAIFCFFLVTACSNSSSFGQSIEATSSEYLQSLADGTLDGYIIHDKSYLETINAVKQSVPSDMWAQREISTRNNSKIQLQQNDSYVYGYGNNSCYNIVKKGATVKIKEVRSINSLRWQVFYDVSYINQENVPQISLINENNRFFRFFRSGIFRVEFEKPGEKDSTIALSGCVAIPETINTWPVPHLSAEDVLKNAAPKVLPIYISKKIGVSSYRSWNSWNEYVNAGQLMKTILENHGWSVSGFHTPSVPHYSIQGTIKPSISAQKYILRDEDGIYHDGGGVYKVVFLKKAKSTLIYFNAQEDRANATIYTTFSGCTEFCKLWQDVRAMSEDYGMGRSLFEGYTGRFNPKFNLSDTITTEAVFSWTPNRGWFLEQRNEQLPFSSLQSGPHLIEDSEGDAVIQEFEEEPVVEDDTNKSPIEKIVTAQSPPLVNEKTQAHVNADVTETNKQLDKAKEQPSIPAPLIKIGDNYVYETINQSNTEPTVTTKKTVLSSGDEIVFSTMVISRKKARERKLYFNSEWNLIRTRNSNNGGLDYSPPIKYYEFPLYPGKTWQQTTTETDIKTKKTKTHTITGTVEQWEDVTVPAGTFHAIRVNLGTEVYDPSTGERVSGTDTSWYVPEVNRSVKSVTTGKYGKQQVIQLLRYELK